MHTTRALGPGAGLSWLKRAIQLGRHNARAVFGAIALVALVGMLPAVLQLVLQGAFDLDADSEFAIAGASNLLMLLISLPMVGGVLRVIDAAEHARDTRAAAVFDTFKSGQGAARLIGLGTLMFAIYLLAFGVTIWLFGDGLPAWYDQVLAATAAQDQAGLQALLPSPPPGFRTVMMLGLLFGLFLGGVCAIAFGQIALAGEGVFAALRDGFVGTLKNALPLLVFIAIAFALVIPFLLVMMLLMLFVAAIGGMVSEALALLLMLPINLGMLLVLNVVAFGVMYHLWRDVCAVDAAKPADAGVMAA